MKRVIICLTIVTVWLIHLTSSPVLAAQDRRIALVIGNGAYKSAPLRNPLNGETDMANILRFIAGDPLTILELIYLDLMFCLVTIWHINSKRPKR